MARMLPRRLGHDEEASLVDHLTELRHRLFICLGSIIPAFALAYAFHDDLIDRLKDLLPAGTPLVTFGVTEPFITSLKVSFYAAIALVLPIILWQIWAFLAPAVKEDTQRVLGAFVVLSTALFAAGLVFCYVDRAAEGTDLPGRLRLRPLPGADPGELLPLVRRADAARVRDRVPDAHLRPRARPDRRPHLRAAP